MVGTIVGESLGRCEGKSVGTAVGDRVGFVGRALGVRVITTFRVGYCDGL